ncbi:hypothetical protein OF83DRAFT_423310 [Amylostereum chailletii]|nr:hypothetical protein OF83DRAFT_423310 [Amylostereum chailletii]
MLFWRPQLKAPVFLANSLTHSRPTAPVWNMYLPRGPHIQVAASSTTTSSNWHTTPDTMQHVHFMPPPLTIHPASYAYAPVGNEAIDIWSYYLGHLDERDKVMVDHWKADMDGVLIFSGLFSAIVTAFIVETYKDLQPDNEEMSTQLLVRVVAALENTNTSAVGVTPFDGPSTSASLWINILWFLSLLLSIVCAISATLVQQWFRKYIQRWSSERIQSKIKKRKDLPNRKRFRAQAHASFTAGIDRFGLVVFVNSVSYMLHLALFFFAIGLVIFASTIHNVLASITLSVTVLMITAYGVFTLLPYLFVPCPYRTPLFELLRSAEHTMKSVFFGRADGEAKLFTPASMAGRRTGSEFGRRRTSKEKTIVYNLMLDRFIVRRTTGIWLTENNLTDANLEALFRSLPGIVLPALQAQLPEGFEFLDSLLFDGIGVGHELPRLLKGCTHPVHQRTWYATNRAKACLLFLSLLITFLGETDKSPRLSAAASESCILPSIPYASHWIVHSQDITLQWEAARATMLLVGLLLHRYRHILKTVEYTIHSYPGVFPNGLVVHMENLFRIRNRLGMALRPYISHYLSIFMDIIIHPNNPPQILSDDITRTDSATSMFPDVIHLHGFVKTQLAMDRHPSLLMKDNITFDYMSGRMPDWDEATPLDQEETVREIMNSMLASRSARHGLPSGTQGPYLNVVGTIIRENARLNARVLSQTLSLFSERG